MKGREGERERRRMNSPQFSVSLALVLDVALEAERVSGSEADGMIVVAVRKFGANERSVFVRMFTEPGTAESETHTVVVVVVVLLLLLFNIECIHRWSRFYPG